MRHEERAHSFLSPSGAHRWMVCPPSARVEQMFPDTTSEAASEGTLAHEIAEWKLRSYFMTPGKAAAKETAEKMAEWKQHKQYAAEMLEYTDVYLDYVKETALGMPTTPFVALEQKVPLGEWIPAVPGDNAAFGSADCILISSMQLHIIDFKYGKGVKVFAERNPQLMLYALGAYSKYRMFYPVEQVHLHIVQPRLEHYDTWSCTMAELLEFASKVKEKATLALNGQGEFYPTPEACRFCRARAVCKARAQKNLEPFQKTTLPELLTEEELGAHLKQGEDVARWLDDLEKYVLAQSLSGKQIPGWKAVEGRGSREWVDLDKAFAEMEKKGFGAMLWERKPVSVAALEKALGKKVFEEAASSYVVKKPGKPTLVADTDKRPAITNKVAAKDVFKEEQS